jgi:anti-sigma-K factor RskA
MPEEAVMRRLIENLIPDSRRVYWRWVAGVLSVYVVLLLSAAATFSSHESSRNLRHETAAVVAIKGNRAPSHQASTAPLPSRVY